MAEKQPTEIIILGETATDAYRGDRGKAAYEHISDKNNPHEVDNADVGLGNVTNDAQEKLSNKVNSWSGTVNDTHYPTEKLVKDSLDNKVDKVSGKGLSANDFTNAYKTALDNLGDKEDKTNKVTSLSSSSTDTEYPSAKCVYDAINSGAVPPKLILTYDTSRGMTFSFNNTIAFTFTGTVTVDWGDGSTEIYTEDVLRHTYSSNGVYTITVTGNITQMNSFAFSNTPSISAVINVNAAGYSFMGSNLKSSVITNNVTSLGMHTFSGCSNLETVIFESATPLTLGAASFYNVPTTCKIYVPKGSLSAYTSASNYPSSSDYTYIEYEKNEENLVLSGIIDGVKYPVSSDAVHDALADKSDTNHTHASNTITDENTYSNIGNLTTNQASINSAINDKLAAIANIDINVLDTAGSNGEPSTTASADTMNKLYFIKVTANADDNYDTFITIRSGTSGNYIYTWEKVDTTSLNLSDYAETSNLAIVATSGSYADLLNKPSFTPTITSSTTGAYKIGSINISGSNVDIYGKDQDLSSYSTKAQTIDIDSITLGTTGEDAGYIIFNTLE